MIKEITGNIWDFHSAGYWIVIPTNGIVSPNTGKAVMGAGLALQAKEKFPKLPKELGRRIYNHNVRAESFPQYKLICFPTKYDWRKPSSLKLIVESSVALNKFIEESEETTLYMPQVGCGRGELVWSVVKQALHLVLDHRVVICDWKNDVQVRSVRE